MSVASSNVTVMPKPEPTLAAIDKKLDKITDELAYLVARQKQLEELMAEVAPIARVAMDGAIEKLADLEAAGYFAFAGETLRVIDRIVRSYSAEDVRRLGDQVVGIVDTVRNLTQPDMLAMMNDVADAVHHADDADPKGMWGMARAGKDPDVRKGMGMLVAILKQVGRAADKIGKAPPSPPPVRLAVYQGKDGEGPPNWVKHLARRRVQVATPVTSPGSQRTVATPAAAPAAHAACAPKVPAKPVFEGVPALPPGYGADGFLKDTSLWTKESAQAMAALTSVTLTEQHWTILEWARQEHAQAGASPNIRRLSVGTGVSIRDLYALFPGKPGVLVAMIAGIPKPGGCL